VKSALYHHFGSKSGLLNTVLQHRAEVWIEGMREAVEVAGDSPGAKLDALIEALRRLVVERPGNRRMLLSMVLEDTDDTGFWPAGMAAYGQVRGAMRDGILATVLVDPKRAAVMADCFVDMFDGLFLRFQLEQDRERLDEALREMRRTMIARIEYELKRS